MLIEVTNLCVVQIHSLTVLMEDASNGIHGVMETMTAETIVMKKNAQVRRTSICKICRYEVDDLLIKNSNSNVTK